MQAMAAKGLLVKGHSRFVRGRNTKLNAGERGRTAGDGIPNQFQSIYLESVLFDPGTKIVVIAVVGDVGE